MVNVSVLFILASSLSVFAYHVFERSFDALRESLDALGHRLTSLDDELKKFPTSGGTLREALGIHEDGVEVTHALNSCTDAANSIDGLIGEKDALDILGFIEATKPSVHDAVNEIIVKKRAFQAIPPGGVAAFVKQDLEDLDKAAVPFGDALISKCPENLKDRATALRDDYHNELTRAFNAYVDV